MFKYASEIKFVKYRHTTPVTVEFSSSLKSGNNIINITAIHCKIFAAMKILDSSLKLITQVGKTSKHPKYFPTRNEYKTCFANTTKELDRYKSKNIFSRHTIESALKLDQLKHNNENAW